MSKPTDTWDVPIRKAREHKPAVREWGPDRPATVEQAVKSWLRARAYSSSTESATLHHLCGARATGWRQRERIKTIDQLTAAKGAEYLIYLRERGAAPSFLVPPELTILTIRVHFSGGTPNRTNLRGAGHMSFLQHTVARS
jgi:hypothetical protein